MLPRMWDGRLNGNAGRVQRVPTNPDQPGVSRMYIGPDALMPLASAFAAIAGFVLMFWRRIVGAVKFLFNRGAGKGAGPAES